MKIVLLCITAKKCNMISKIKILLLFVFVSQYGFSQEVGGIDKQWMKELIGRESKSFSKKYSVNSNHTSNYDIKFNRIELEVNPEVFYIKGKVTTYFVPTTDLTNIKFDFTDYISVDEVIYNGNSINFSQNNDILTCNFPTSILANKLDSIEVIYSGIPKDNIDGITQDFHKSVPIISTLSEPYEAKEWWPCKQDLIDKIDSVEVIITNPKIYRGVSNGLLIKESIVGDNRVSIWKHKYPIPAYLIAFSVTNYEEFIIDYKNINNEILPIQNFVYPENLEEAKTSLEKTKLSLKLFEELFEIYPYSKEKYGHAQFAWGGGMEHTTITFLGSFSEDLIAHELAHQWFGDKVTCGSWGDIWLNEGFATYLTGLTYENYKGNFKGWLQGKISHVTRYLGGSVYVTDTTLVSEIFSSRTSYSKGAMVLHMLRWQMGDDNFFTSIKNYLKDEKLEYSYAKTTDLKKHCEAVYGKDLTIFFNQWIYGEGYPSYTVEWKQKEDKAVIVNINQSQSHPSVKFFEMPIELLINGVNGEKSYVRLDVNHQDYTNTLDVDFEVSSIEFDPNLWLITKNNSVKMNPDLAVSDLKKESWTVATIDDDIVISTSNKSINSINVNLFDTSGKIIISQKLNRNSNFTLSTVSIAKGVYYLVIDTGNRIVSKTILR